MVDTATPEPLNRSYPLATLMIYAAKQEITVDKIKAVFDSLALDFSPKIASLFVLPSEKISSILSTAGSAPVAPTTQASEAPAAEVPEEKEESSDGEIDLF